MSSRWRRVAASGPSCSTCGGSLGECGHDRNLLAHRPPHHRGGAGWPIPSRVGKVLLERLSADLTARFGRGFSRQNLQQMRQFYLLYPPGKIRQTASGKSPSRTIRQTSSGESALRLSDPIDGASSLPLPWSHYVRLMSVETPTPARFMATRPLPIRRRSCSPSSRLRPRPPGDHRRARVVACAAATACVSVQRLLLARGRLQRSRELTQVCS